MEEAQKKAEEDARKQQQRGRRPSPPERDPNQKEVEVDFDVKNTGQKKAINGFDTRQVVMTITVREKGKTLEQSGGLVMTVGHVAGAEDCRDEGDRRLRPALRAEAVRPDGRRRLGRSRWRW